MAKITKVQRDTLHAAIDAAKNPGMCKYIIKADNESGEEDVACCVIAQLGILEGTTVDQMWNTWGGMIVSNLPTVNFINRSPEGIEFLAKYPMELLSLLQKTWDRGLLSSTEDVIKGIMKREVDFWFEEEISDVVG